MIAGGTDDAYRKEECDHFIEYKKRVDKTLSEMDESSLQKSITKTPSQYDELVKMCKMADDDVKRLSSTDHHRYKLLRSAKRVYFVEEMPTTGEIVLFRAEYGYENTNKKRSSVFPRRGIRVYDVYQAFDVIRSAHLELKHKIGATKARVRDSAACVTAWMVQIFIDTCPLCAARLAAAKRPNEERRKRRRQARSATFGARCRARAVGLPPALLDGHSYNFACIVVECSTGAPLAVRPIRSRSSADLGSCVAEALATLGDCPVVFLEDSEPSLRVELANDLDDRLNSLTRGADYQEKRHIVAAPPPKGDETAANTLSKIVSLLHSVRDNASWPRSCASIHCSVINDQSNTERQGQQTPYRCDDDDQIDDDDENESSSPKTFRHLLFSRENTPAFLFASSPQDIGDFSGRFGLETPLPSPCDGQ